MSGARRVTLTREEAAERRIASALNDLQEAQNRVGRAAAALSSLRGMGPDGTAVMKLYAQVKKTWYRVNDKAEKLRKRRELRLDREPTEYEREWGPVTIAEVEAPVGGAEEG